MNFFRSSKRNYAIAKNTEPQFYVYTVECEDGSYYTGYTKDLQNRVINHKMGNGAQYTKEKGVNRLVYFEKYVKEDDARKREIFIKNAGRIYKNSLVMKFQKDLLSIKL